MKHKYLLYLPPIEFLIDEKDDNEVSIDKIRDIVMEKTKFFKMREDINTQSLAANKFKLIYAGLVNEVLRTNR